MLEDSWSLAIILSDLADSFLYFVEHGLGNFSFGIFAAFTFAGFLLYFAWLSTDIPELPEPPRPPYVIQIQGNVNSNRTGSGASGSGRDPNRQTLSDVRLLSSGPIVDSVLQNLPQSARQRQQQHQQQHHRHHGRQSALFFGFLRRPSPQPLIPRRPSSRSRFQSSNVVVYHQVNVFRASQNHNSSSTFSSSSSGINNNVSSSSSANASGASSSVPEQTATSIQNSSEPTTSSGLRDRSAGSRVSPDNNCEAFIPQFPGPSNSTICEPISDDSAGSYSSSINFQSSTRRSLNSGNDGNVDFDSEVEEIEVELDEEDLDDLEVSDSRTAVDVNVNGDVRIVEQNFSDRSSFPTPSASTSPRVHFQGDLHVTSSPSTNSNPTNNLVNVSMTRTSDTSNVKAENEQGESRTTDSPIRSNSNSSVHAPNSNTNTSSTKSPPQNQPNQDVRVTLKFLNDTQLEVTTQLSEKILDFKRRHFATELSENKIIRLIFNGRVLDNDVRTLEESGIFDHCVVHCLIVTPQPSQQRGGDGHGGGVHSGSTTSRNSSSRLGRPLREGGPEPGMFFVSVLGIVLIFLWFICFHFGQQLFTQSAVVSLVVLTAVFVIGLVALYLPVQSNNT